MLFHKIIEFLKKLLGFLGIRFSSKREKNKNKLIDAVTRQDFNAVLLLVQRGVNLDVKDKNGKTPLMIAVDKNNDAICELLLTPLLKNRKAADTRIKDNNGKTALMIAIQNGNGDIVRLLIDHGADISVKTKDNKNMQELVFWCKDQVISKINEKYKEIFNEIQKESKNQDYSVFLEEMIDKKKIYEDKLKELNFNMEHYEKDSDIDNINKFINEREKYKGIVEVLNNRNKYEEVLAEIKNIEKYQDVEAVLEDKYESDMINKDKEVNHNKRLDLSNDDLSNNDLPKEEIPDGVVFEYDFDIDNKDGKEK